MSTIPNSKKKPEPKKIPAPPAQPKHPNTKGAPDDHDPDAQYEEKSES